MCRADCWNFIRQMFAAIILSMNARSLICFCLCMCICVDVIWWCFVDLHSLYVSLTLVTSHIVNRPLSLKTTRKTSAHTHFSIRNNYECEITRKSFQSFAAIKHPLQLLYIFHININASAQGYGSALLMCAFANATIYHFYISSTFLYSMCVCVCLVGKVVFLKEQKIKQKLYVWRIKITAQVRTKKKMQMCLIHIRNRPLRWWYFLKESMAQNRIL